MRQSDMPGRPCCRLMPGRRRFSRISKILARATGPQYRCYSPRSTAGRSVSGLGIEPYLVDGHFAEMKLQFSDNSHGNKRSNVGGGQTSLLTALESENSQAFAETTGVQNPRFSPDAIHTSANEVPDTASLTTQLSGGQ